MNIMETVQGYIKWFNNRKGYGFIKQSNSEMTDDIFIHYKNIITNGYRHLNDGDIVEFELVTTDRGLSAKNVNIISSKKRKKNKKKKKTITEVTS